MSPKRYYPRIDFAKFFLSFFVIAIHTLNTNIAIPSHYRLRYILDFAVPFYFIGQGFLILNNQAALTRATVADRILHAAKHVLKLYMIWTIVYLPVTIYCSILYHTPFLTALRSFIRGVLFIGENPYSWPLWFLLSAFYSLGVIYLMLKYTNFKHGFFYLLALVSFILCILFNYLPKTQDPGSILKQLLLRIPSGRIFRGLFYIMIGLYISENNDKIQKLLSKIPHLILILLLSANILTVWSWQFVETEPFLIWGSTVLFLCCLKPCEVPSPVSVKLRNASTLNYFTHMIWFVLYSRIFLNEMGHRCISAFIVTSLACLLFSFLLLRKPENSFVKHLL